MSSFQERLIQAMKVEGYLNANQLSTALGYDSPETISRIFRDDKNKPSYRIIEDIARLFNKTDIKWLITGVSELNANMSDISTKTKSLNEPLGEYATAYKTTSDGIPLLDAEAAAGRGNEVFNLNNYDIEANYFIPDFEKVDFMLKVRGNSMWPKYNGGDLVACRIIKSLTSIQWNRAYVIAAGENGILIKRLKRSTIEGNYLLVSDNKEYDPIEMPISEVQGLALVVGTIRLE